jgi:hypothetical protein
MRGYHRQGRDTVLPTNAPKPRTVQLPSQGRVEGTGFEPSVAAPLLPNATVEHAAAFGLTL